MCVSSHDAVANLPIDAFVTVCCRYLYYICASEGVLLNLHSVHRLSKNWVVVVDVQDHNHNFCRGGQGWLPFVYGYHCQAVIGNFLSVQLSSETDLTIDGPNAEPVTQRIQERVLNVAVGATVWIGRLSLEDNSINRGVFWNVRQLGGKKHGWVIIDIQQDDGDLGCACEPGGRRLGRVMDLNDQVVEGLAFPVQGLEGFEDSVLIHCKLPKAVT